MFNALTAASAGVVTVMSKIIDGASTGRLSRMFPLHVMLAALVGWIAGEQREVIEYLRVENQVLRAQLRGRRVHLSDAERRRLAILGARLGRPILTQVATIVPPDTILRWHRELIARKRT